MRVRTLRPHEPIAEALKHHERGAAQRTANILAGLYNWTGMQQPKTPAKPADFLQGEAKEGMSGSTMDKERYRANYERHLQRTNRHE